MFVIVVFVLLLFILLLYDFRVFECVVGCYDFLVVIVRICNSLWLLCIVIFIVVLWFVLIIFFLFGSVVNDVGIVDVFIISVIVLVYLFFWLVICYLVVWFVFFVLVLVLFLLGGWLFIIFIIFVVGDVVIDEVYYGLEGGDILMIQWEVVNDVWDLLYQVIMDVFFEIYLQW